ncbi:MAG: DUF4197 domain-containing protein [Bacteroidota bacterium]
MKRIFLTLSIFSSTLLVSSSCDILNAVSTGVVTPAKPSLTNDEVISGLKEALMVGIKNSVNLSSVTDGFLKNDLIKLPFPEDAIKVRQKALEWGFTSQVEKFETTLNRAAEEASKEALPIFMDAIKGMSVQDGFAILNGGNGAATSFLKSNTSTQLTTAFSPIVKNAISKVKLTEYWNPIINKYNGAMTITGGEKINPDLDKYVTERAISGLFKLVEIEEDKIRKDPLARVSDILVKVFGSITN